MMLMRRFNLKKEILSLQRILASNEIDIKDYETYEETKEFAYEARKRVWANRARKDWRSDTSYVDEHLDLGYYALTDREREMARSNTLLVLLHMRHCASRWIEPKVVTLLKFNPSRP